MTDANKIHDISEDNSSNTFVSAVRKMRTAQRKFLREKNTTNYKAMLEAEQKVDAMLADTRKTKIKTKAFKSTGLIDFV